MAISRDRFGAVYRTAVNDVMEHWNETMQAEISVHNVGWHPSRYRFDTYLRASVERYYLAYERAVTDHPGELCDIGGFWGVFPLTLKRLGYDVAMTEALQYYSASFNDLFSRLRSEGIDVIDYDPFDAAAVLPRPFQTLFVMAVLEHYPHSLRIFMQNMYTALAPSATMYVEVPNIAYWPKRMGLLRGHSPHPPIADIYTSAIPFTGHHHEFTGAELRQLAALAGFKVKAFDSYNYSPEGSWMRRLIDRPLETVALTWVPSAREVLSMTCSLDDA